MGDLVVPNATPSTKRGLLVLSHAMERAFDMADPDGESGEPGLIVALFQQRAYFDVEADRYAALAAAGHTVVAGFCGRTVGVPAGVHVVSLTESDARAQLWVLVLVRGAYATSLVAGDRFDLSGSEHTFQASRQFDARTTFRRADALADAWELVSGLAPDLPPEVVAAITSHLERSAAIPVASAEDRVATAADHLVRSVGAGQVQVDRLRAELEDSHFLAERDQLTGLHNRHYLERFLGGDDGPADLLAMLVDVDDLKIVNNRHGHAGGDALLASVAFTLRQHARPGDVVVRWGGDEFLVLMAALKPDSGLATGQRLADAVRESRLAAPWQDIRPSVSIGICGVRRTSLPLDRLDAALYKVKRSGKGHAYLDKSEVLAVPA